MSTHLYQVRQLSLSYPSGQVLRQLSFEIRAGEIVGVLGPNGAGKSSLVRILANLLESWQGDVLFEGKDLRSWGRRAFSQKVSYLPQDLSVAFSCTVQQVVQMGRLAHQDWNFFDTAEDRRQVRDALERCGAAHLENRPFNQLSGGERRLVTLAAALAQQPEVLILDEPTTHLDLRHQLDVCRILAGLGRHLTILLVTHDLNFAHSFCSRWLLLRQGRLAADLSREARIAGGLEAGLIRQIFGIDIDEVSLKKERRIFLNYPCFPH